jgi:hypothetical protein
MRASTKIACGLILAAGVATAAQAQYHPYLPEQNTKEIDFAGSVTFEPVDSLALTGRLGYFVNRHLQVGLDGAYSRVSNGHSERVWSLGGFANWHFPGSSQMLPYVGGFLGYADAGGAANTSSFGAQGGVKYFFNPNVATFGELRWRNIDGGSDQTGLFFGLSVFFK